MTEWTDCKPAAEFVERMGLLWQGEGLPRIAGRIFGLLAFAPTPLTIDDMAGALGVSRASISTDARRLSQLGVLDRSTRPGDRRDYYTVAVDAPAQMLALRLEAIGDFEAALGTMCGRAELHPDAAERLERLARAHRKVKRALAALLEELRQEANDTTAATAA